jgi:hypothetical protein
MKKKLVLLACSSLAMNTIWSQETELGAWYAYFGSNSIKSSSFIWHNEIQYRNFNAIGDLDQLLLRTGIGYNLTDKNNNILLGYGYIQNNAYVHPKESDERKRFGEHRIFQQFTTRQSFTRVGIQHRYRFEQRFFANDFRTRLRYFLNVTVPVNKPAMTANAIYLSAYNEIFINTNKNIFDRNRAFVGVGYVLQKDLRFDVGFMRQMLHQHSRNQLVLSLFNNLALGKRDEG